MKKPLREWVIPTGFLKGERLCDCELYELSRFYDRLVARGFRSMVSRKTADMVEAYFDSAEVKAELEKRNLMFWKGWGDK
jgi:hypothetical protein